MIQANELRIGNWINYGGTTPRKVSMIIEDGRIAVDLLMVKADTLSPILLTPEILEKAGFVLNEKIWRWVKDGITICNNEDDTGFYWDLSRDGGFTLSTEWKNISYLHQLQNLYFALTGKELFTDAKL